MAQGKKKPAGTPLLEWIAAGVGLLLTLGLLAVIGREALSGETERLPSIQVAVLRVAPAAAGFVVEIEARNGSGGNAAAVEIEGAVKDGAAILETSGFTFDYVPGHSRRRGGLFFREDPRRHQFEVRALGFQTP